MFKNSEGKLVPHCLDCKKCDPIDEDRCPDDALIEVDDERGVLDCPGFEKIDNIT